MSKDRYNDNVRQDDALYLERLTEFHVGVLDAKQVRDALCLFLTDPVVRPMLECIDPKGVEQARRALGVPGS